MQRCNHCFKLEQEISVLKAREQATAARLKRLMPTIQRLVNKERGEAAWAWLTREASRTAPQREEARTQATIDEIRAHSRRGRLWAR